MISLLDERRQQVIRLPAIGHFVRIADRRAQGFSHGERAKVALARALVHDPQNVLLDEPTNGLDVMSTRAVREIIRGLRARGRCVLFSSHVMQEVSALCDRIVVIARGRVVAEGTPEEIKARAGKDNLEEAFVSVIGTDQGLMPRAIIRSMLVRRPYTSSSLRVRTTCGRLLVRELSSMICTGALRPASNSLP